VRVAEGVQVLLVDDHDRERPAQLRGDAQDRLLQVHATDRTVGDRRAWLRLAGE
jgi:hypothetical protein